MYYQTCCADVTLDQWHQLMKGARKVSYSRLVQRIKKELPDIYQTLALNLYNPYWEQCKQTKTHYILVSSSIEYFIHKWNNRTCSSVGQSSRLIIWRSQVQALAGPPKQIKAPRRENPIIEMKIDAANVKVMLKLKKTLENPWSIQKKAVPLQ